MTDLRRRILSTALICGFMPLRSLAKVVALCPTDPSISDHAAPLTIDVHAHIFNGGDLQIRQFLSQTVVGRDSELFPLVDGMGSILQRLAWHFAPNAAAERQALGLYAKKLKGCSGSEQQKTLASEALQQGYGIGRRELRTAADALAKQPEGAAVLGPKEEQAGLGAAIYALPPSFEDFENLRADSASVLGSQPTFTGYIQFVLHHFYYRHVNAIDYLTTYGRGPRKVDLVVACMVDYDYWLARGSPTSTPLPDQIDLMRQISVLLAGRLHGFVPFCPFREMMTQDASGIGDSMRLVMRAIGECGFIGVKLYPPMGFAPWGNAGKTVWRNKSTLLPAAADPLFGKRLDQAMERLFVYCETNDVPIMAHTNHSNGPYEEFKDLAGSGYWKLALAKFPGLRVSFGHLGDTDIEDHNGKQSRPFLELMSKAAGAPGEHAFADSSYFAGALMNQQRMRDTLHTLYTGNKRIMLERMMYGTDWTMILPQKNADRYLREFIQVIARIEALEPGIGARNTTLSNAFFSRNAVEFLGLQPNRGNRRRLDAFYEHNNVVRPDWMAKLYRD
jgi:predicted TIM-barrel fold metal-dependent hydrolase